MLNYDIDIPDNQAIRDILESDFWIYRHLPVGIIKGISEPVKFTSNASIFVSRGECNADIDLLNYRINGPTVVNIRTGQILMPSDVSDDFDASVMVMSKRMWDSIFMLIKDCKSYPVVRRYPVTEISEDLVDEFEQLYIHLDRLSKEKENPYIMQTIIFGLTTFFFHLAHRCYDRYVEKFPSVHSRVVDRFISLVQQNFRKERFLDFYASKLDITAKHLSRTVKAQTGFTAVEWIERYVIYEAKVMLKSSNLTVQQISDELYFPSQSFFGKYFKKSTGMSPKEFRNT